MIIGASTTEYERRIHNDFCPDAFLIKSEEQCKLAAADLNIPFDFYIGFQGNANNEIAGCSTMGVRRTYRRKHYYDDLTGLFRARFNHNLTLITDTAKINKDFRAICAKKFVGNNIKHACCS